MLTISDGDLITAIREAIVGCADAERAPAMQAYMKSALPFAGVGVPAVRQLTRACAAAHPVASGDELESAVRTLWREASVREERYAAVALLGAPATRGLRGPHQLPLLRDLIVDGAWWDLVDGLAPRVGDLLGRWPVEVTPVIRAWSADPDRWLRRVSVICQLGRKQGTDLELLTDAIEANAADPDFFLRKAIGWALRDLARTRPDWVRGFVAGHDLSPLSRREALKHLG